MSQTTKKKIVVLGGGMGGMAAVYGITESPNWQAEYDITVYQLGWRLGGKGASGRNLEKESRIEEHGLHVWGGFYENAFRTIRSCYTELNRPPTTPLATWDEAFKPSAMVSWMEDLQPWIAWNNRFIEYPSTPGDGKPMPSLWEGVLRILEWMVQTYFDLDGAAGTLVHERNAPLPPESAKYLQGEPKARQSGLASHVLEWVEHGAHEAGRELLIGAYEVMRRASPDPKQHDPSSHALLVHLLSGFQAVRHGLYPAGSQDSDGKRRLEILIDLALAEVKGIVEDGVLIGGFEAINDIDLVAWFTKHGARGTSVDSGLVRGSYDFIFAYEDGDPNKPLLEAGTGLRMIFRLIMWYKGAVFWKMQAGMGDTIFGPLYEVLKARGVRFKFFHKVEHLGLSARPGRDGGRPEPPTGNENGR